MIPVSRTMQSPGAESLQVKLKLKMAPAGPPPALSTIQARTVHPCPLSSTGKAVNPVP